MSCAVLGASFGGISANLQFLLQVYKSEWKNARENAWENWKPFILHLFEVEPISKNHPIMACGYVGGICSV